MINFDLLNEIKSLVSKGKLETAINSLRGILDPLPDNLIVIEARFYSLVQNFNLGVIDYKEFNQLSNQCNIAFLNFLKDFEKEKQLDSVTTKLNPQHQFTCNRKEQYNEFLILLSNQNRTRQHFLYIFGGESQAHRGFFQRCVNRLKGADLDHIHPSRGSDFQIESFVISIPCLENIYCLEIELSRIVLARLEISEKEIGKIREWNLALGIAKSPLLSHFSSDGKIFFHFSITEALWNVQIVPNLLRSFIKDFCLQNLTTETPELFFFFSVEYDDDNHSIRSEIASAMQKAQFLKGLGELKMVSESDVNNWFSFYGNFWETASERKATKNKYFGEKTPEMYMDEVQLRLKKVINEINNNEKYVRRK